MAQQISLWEFQEKPVTVISDSEQECLLILEEKANTVIDYMLTAYPKLKLWNKNIIGLNYEIPYYSNSVRVDFLGWEEIDNIREFEKAVGELAGMECFAIESGDTIHIRLYYHNHRW